MYINILFILIMIAAIIAIARHQNLSRALKGFVITMLLLSVGLATLFEYTTIKAQNSIRPIIIAFKEGKKLDCKTKNIDNTIYSYEPGTSSFQPRLNVVGETFGVHECNIIHE